MKTPPWLNTSDSKASGRTPVKMWFGMIGLRATRHSICRKRIKATTPKMIRQRTVADLHGCVTPPICKPIRNMIVLPVMVRLPSQSMALRARMTDCLSWCNLRVKRIINNAVPEVGTAIREKAFSSLNKKGEMGGRQ